MTSQLRKYRLLAFSGAGIALVAAVILGCGVESRAPVSADPAPEVEMPAVEMPPSGEFGSVQYATESNFEDLVLRAKGPVLVDFYADWCPPCQILAPRLDDLAREAPHLLVVKVDVDQARSLARQYGIESIPSLKVFQGGEVVGQHVGLASKDELKSLVGI